MNESIGAIHPTAFVFAGLSLVGAFLAVRPRNILHATFGLALCVLGLAALFLYLGSPFVAAMEVVIYVGGISVAIVFAIMFSYTLGVRDSGRRMSLLAAGVGLVFFAAVGYVFAHARFALAGGLRDWSLKTVGRMLLDQYNLVFEVLSVILLLAIVGAIAIARRARTP